MSVAIPIKPIVEDCAGLMDWSHKMMVYKMELDKWTPDEDLNPDDEDDNLPCVD